MRRIAIVQLGYESNTFVSTRATLTDLAPDGWIAADTVVQRFDGRQYISFYTPIVQNGKQLLVVEYNQSDELVAVSPDIINLRPGKNQIDITSLLPETTGHSIKIMVWDSLTTLKPLVEVLEITKQ